MKETVGKAYLAQAKEDLCGAELLGRQMLVAPSTFCMLLQMVFEKLAKAQINWTKTNLPSKNSHEVAGFFFSKYFDAYFRSARSRNKYYNLLKIIRELEEYQPSIAGKKGKGTPQLEYPWVKNGIICTPCEDLPLVNHLRQNSANIVQMYSVLKFAREFANNLK